MQNSSSNPTLNWLVMLAAAVVVVAGMKVASPVVVPVLLALFIAAITAPALLWLENKGLPTLAALLVVIGILLGAGALLVTLIGASLSEFQSQQPVYQARLETLFEQLQSFLAQITSLLGVSFQISDFASALNPNSIAAGVGKAVNEIGALIANAFLIFLIVVFMLFEVSTLPKKLESIFTESSNSIKRLAQFKRSLQRYLVIKTVTSLTTAVLVWMMLAIIGVDFAVLWAVLAFFLNFVPNIGSIIAAVPAVLVAIMQIDLSAGLWVAVGYLVINNIVGTVIEPRIAGRHLGLSPLIVFLSLLFWGWILGPVGMFLSVPLTMMVRLVAESSENTRWIAVMLSDRAPSS